MAKTKTVITSKFHAVNAGSFKAKEQRRIEKANYSPVEKMEIVEKLRDTARALRSAKLVKKGAVVRG